MDPERHYNQPLTYWGVLTHGEFGSASFSAPVNFKGRWVDKVQNVLSSKGTTVVSQAQIHYPEAVDIQADGYLVRGNSSATDPTMVPGAFKVLNTGEIPDIRSLRRQRVALL